MRMMDARPDAPVNIYLRHHPPPFPRRFIVTLTPRFIRLAIRRGEVERVKPLIEDDIVKVLDRALVSRFWPRDLEGRLGRRRWRWDCGRSDSNGSVARREEERFAVGW